MKWLLVFYMATLPLYANPSIVLSIANGAQSLNGVYIVSGSVGVPLTLDASASTGSGSLTFAWSQTSGPTGTFSAPNSAVTTITTSAFGTAYVTISATDSNGTTNQSIKVGGVIADNNGVVNVAAEPPGNGSKISAILGPLIRLGMNPWTWADNRSVAMSGLQIAEQSTIWADYWDTYLSGTVAVTVSGAYVVLVGTGTTFQSDFCGGNGNTIPTSGAMVVLRYPVSNPSYSGSFGAFQVNVSSCDTQTRMTLAFSNWPWAKGTGPGCSTGIPACGLHYAFVTQSQWGYWASGGLPGNYYDNVLSLYAMYYRSGIDDFLKAARVLASRYWVIYANFYDGFYYWLVTTAKNDATFVGEPKNNSITGLILWNLDQGTDTWSGINFVLSYWDYVMVQYPAGYRSWNTDAGDLRDDGYMMAGFGLGYLLSPSSTIQSMCLNDIHQALNHLFIPLESGNTWNIATVQPQGPQCSGCGAAGVFGSPDGSIYVTVTDGSPTITLHGSTWAEGNFTESSPYDMPVWFCSNCWGYGQFGINGTTPVKQISDIGGDSAAYLVRAVTDSTHATLTTKYNSGSCPTGCNKTMEIAATAGMGVLPYMHGMLIGAFASYDVQALTAAGPSYSTDLEQIKRLVSDGLTFLQGAFDPGGLGMYGAMNFQGCTAYLNPNHCAPGNVPAGEAMRGFSAGFLLSPTSLNKASGDTVYNSFWAKPGYKSPIGLNGPCAPYVHCYLYAANDVLDSDGGGFMLTAANAQMNKWQGFYWGYGFGFSWPVVRLTTTGPARVPAGIKVSGSATMSGQQRQQAR